MARIGMPKEFPRRSVLPLIVKSTQGKGVVLAETKKAAQSVISAFRGLKANFLVQDFVKEANGDDIRCWVIDGKVVASMKRSAAAGDFRSNLHQGGQASTVRHCQSIDWLGNSEKATGKNIAGLIYAVRPHAVPKQTHKNPPAMLAGFSPAVGGFFRRFWQKTLVFHRVHSGLKGVFVD